jgi:DNA (cytosine-5)-methyltransferase 1
MRTVSLFSGCGGMDMGADRAGAEIVFANDILPEARETYRRWFPDVEFNHGPIADVERLPSADLVIGGYPCQSFTLGGRRRPSTDPRSLLYAQFARCVDDISPRFFVAENVSGMKGLENGRWLAAQLDLFAELGRGGGYRLSWQMVRAEEYGVPQRRKRLFIVGVRRDLKATYTFPHPTHGSGPRAQVLGLKPLASHGDAIAHLPLWPEGEFYERPHDPEGHWPWWYLSRNRKADWDAPSYTVVSNSRHVTVHPASPSMKMVWSNLADGFKQRWEFSNEYEHLKGHPERPVLEVPRRLSWREAALLQTFPSGFEPAGTMDRKYEQIGNAVPPLLVEALLRPLIDESGLVEPSATQEEPPAQPPLLD